MMTCTPPGEPGAADRAATGGDGERIDGFTLEELSDYLDSGRRPERSEIERSSEARRALSRLEHLAALSGEVLAVGAEQTVDESWLRGLLGRLSGEVRAGRAVPIASDGDGGRLTVSEGALRALVRDTVDGLGEAIVSRTRFAGELETPGAPITVHVEIAVYADTRLPDAAARARTAVDAVLRAHAELAVAAVDVAITDVLMPRGRRGGTG